MAFLVAVPAVSAQTSNSSVDEPQLELSPESFNLTGNNTIPANRDNEFQVEFQNLDDSRPITNVSIPGNEYLSWSENGFRVNESSSKNVTLTVRSEVPESIDENISIDYRYREGNETFEAIQSQPVFDVVAETFFIDTEVSTRTLTTDFELDFGETGSSGFELRNIGNETAFNINASAPDVSVKNDQEFNLSVDDSRLLEFDVSIPKPEENATEKTNQTYTRTVLVTGDNFETESFTVEVFVPFKQYDQEEETRDLLEQYVELQQRRLELCEKESYQNTTLCGKQLVKTENQTVVEYRNNITKVNFTNEEFEQLSRAIRAGNATEQDISNVRNEINTIQTAVKALQDRNKDRYGNLSEEFESFKEQEDQDDAQTDELLKQRTQQFQALTTAVWTGVGTLVMMFFSIIAYRFGKDPLLEILNDDVPEGNVT